ncbi:MAG: DUF4388 domain-containing protein [Trueperaceae bacterium]
MTGTLGLFSLVDLFQLLAAARRSGRLSIDHPIGPARVYFDKGQVVHADFGSLVGEAAVYALFADERGSFEFRIGMPAVDATITCGTENLVLEAVRRLDESRRGEVHVTLSRDAVPMVPPEGTKKGVTLSEEEQRFIAHVDGKRSVTRVAIDAKMNPDVALAVCDRLVRTGVLRLQTRRARTARLVTRLAVRALPPGAVGVDPNILGAWERVSGQQVTQIACRREDGTVLAFPVAPVPGAGPYLEVPRATLFRANLRVDEALLVRPMPESR